MIEEMKVNGVSLIRANDGSPILHLMLSIQRGRFFKRQKDYDLFLSPEDTKFVLDFASGKDENDSPQ